jgi:hypothetical protein
VCVLTVSVFRMMRHRRRRRHRRGRLLPQRRGSGGCWRLTRRRSRWRADGRRAPALLRRRTRARLGALLGERVAEGAVGDEAVPPGPKKSRSTELNWIHQKQSRATGRNGRTKRTWRRVCRSRSGTPASRMSWCAPSNRTGRRTSWSTCRTSTSSRRACGRSAS